MSKPRHLGISGSLRKASANIAILKAVAEMVADKATLEIFPLHDIPLYNQDMDVEPWPSAVTALRDTIAAADGVLNTSPEYIYGMSGVLKNTHNKATRPKDKTKLTGKPGLTVTASVASTGGVRA